MNWQKTLGEDCRMYLQQHSMNMEVYRHSLPMKYSEELEGTCVISYYTALRRKACGQCIKRAIFAEKPFIATESFFVFDTSESKSKVTVRSVGIVKDCQIQRRVSEFKSYLTAFAPSIEVLCSW
uniref:AlNc14C158G7703 protein n=1 Tax=Albugo laibachii Nc14 TaxID=890382 RepID=F0WML4_9STRA|nr:AlNc14C158G7703 [Albugo laibachii Nc14]|eukprot:CCA22546.1 AlNc14C158G7703 [Albugo laibachii Nc14]